MRYGMLSNLKKSNSELKVNYTKYLIIIYLELKKLL